MTNANMIQNEKAAALTAEARAELEAQADLKATSPSGCRWCGDGDHNGHGVSYLAPIGGHRYDAPTDAQRLNRMKARRA